MSVSSLPEWKQLLLERKRREEEEREMREKEEEKKLASMPAWKRGIIQRRRVKEREGFLKSPSDSLSDTDNSASVHLGSETSSSLDPGQWLDAETKPPSEVSRETTVPVHENPFIRTLSGWRRGRDAEKAAEVGYQERGNEQEAEVGKDKEREKDKPSPRGHDGESGRGRDIELKIERFRDKSEGREKDRSRTESVKDAAREREKESLKVEEEDPPSPLFAPLVAGLRTIRADNIIIIEQDRKGSDEKKRGRWREMEREISEEDRQEIRGMKMDLREILAGGGSVTEIRASEVLIIKPMASPEERSGGGAGRGGGGGGKGLGRGEHRTDVAWLREKERDTGKEKEKPWGQATVIIEDRRDSSHDSVSAERGGRVSQLLSRFGEHPKLPSRSKSSENFIRPDLGKDSGDHEDDPSPERKAGGKDAPSRSAPKRSVSFSDKVLCAKENGVVVDEGRRERDVVEGTPSGKRADVAEGGGSERELTSDRFGKRRDVKTNSQTEAHAEREPTPKSNTRNETDICTSAQHRAEAEKVEPGDKRAAEMAGDADGDEGFTVASVKNTEGISFARRVPIRQDGKARATGREVKRVEPQVCDKRASELGRGEGTGAEAMQQDYLVTAPLDPASPSHTADSHYRHASAFTECCSLLCTVADRPGGTGPQGPYLTQSVMSQNTDDPIGRTERIGETTVYSSERGERAYSWGAHELNKESTRALDAHSYSDVCSENATHNVIPKSPKSIAPLGIPPGPLEIQIPRTVFYVAEEEMVERSNRSDDGQDKEGGRGVDGRDSWRIGKPLSRVESLREKIRQREVERMRLIQRGVEDGGASDGADVTQRAGDRYEDGGTDVEREQEAARLVEAGQEGPEAQTPKTAFDVTQEAGVSKTSPQLPVSLALSQAGRREEVTSEYTTALSYGVSREDEPLKHTEERLRVWQREYIDSQGEEREEEEEEEEELSEEEEEVEEEYTSPVSPSRSRSPSPPHHNSLAAMSRIYNLKTVGSRTGLCVRDRAADIPSVHLIKVKPLLSHAQQEPCQQEDVRQRWGGGKHGDNKALSGEDVSGVQAIQRQLEQFQLKEQEGVKSPPPNTPPGQQGARSAVLHQVRTWKKDPQRSASSPRTSESSQRACTPASQLKQSQSSQSSQTRTHTVNPRLHRILGQSPDNSDKLLDCAPTPASSPSSPSPAQSPSVSPSPAPSPTGSSALFSIRSASGGQVKRGATITITPKKLVGGGGGGAAKSTPAGLSPAKPSAQQAQTPSEEVKKRYATVEEIEVIGGYLNLERSCLVKSRGTPKRVKVCFDEVQLEQVCEYPSENSMLACTPYPHDLGRDERPQEEEAQEEEEVEERGGIVPMASRSVGTATGRVLRVDESCPR